VQCNSETNNVVRRQGDLIPSVTLKIRYVEPINAKKINSAPRKPTAAGITFENPSPPVISASWSQ
jgi:hypothetical protein